eukprot:4317125-Pyramimonas_sp.AAC.1
MDPEDHSIKDPRRILNRDAMPQFFDCHGHRNSQKWVGCAMSTPVATATRQNRKNRQKSGTIYDS